ncbi:MAG: radical SAM protein [Deltaproteobacteria bacterium]|nr:radical SAM protein [Deltaproteobacteria bacterium]MBW2072294.1 radical SAM protein [Deltaproteobacteria bacterium]
MVHTETRYAIKIKPDKFSLWKNKRPLLTHLDMELTERCNNNCIHCYINLPADNEKARMRELTTEEIKEILEEAACLGCLTVRFTGGEPLLREDFEELYIFARRLGLKVMLFTNATLITPALAELFSRIPPLKAIEISVYGMRKNSYEGVTRTPGSFEAAWRGINLLLQNNIPFVVKSALLPPNKKEVDEFEAWAATIPWMDKPPSYSMFFDLRCRRDSAYKNGSIKALRLSPEEGVRVLSRRQEKYFREMEEFCSKFVGPHGDTLFSCSAGTGGGCVDAYGSFQPCMMLRHPATIYDLKNGFLEDALRNFFPGIRARKPENADYLARCARCFLESLCEQCPAKSWMEHGDLDTPVEYLCEIAHAQARHLGMLADGERAWQVQDWQKRIKKLLRRRPAEGLAGWQNEIIFDI